MSLIYQKQAGLNALILGPREALIYPFGVGDWKEIRFGVETFCFASSGLNYTGQEASVSFASGPINPKSCFFFGLKETGINKESYLPFTSGNNFIGFFAGTQYMTDIPIYNYTTSSKTYLSLEGKINFSPTDSDGFRRNNMVLMMNDSGVNSYSNSGTLLVATGPGGMRNGFNLENSGALDLNSTVCKNGLSIVVNNKNLTGQNISLVTYTDQNSAMPSVSLLRDFLSNQSGPAQVSTTFTGYFNSGYSINGGPIKIPDCLFIYNPFFQYQIGITNILIDKYQ